MTTPTSRASSLLAADRGRTTEPVHTHHHRHDQHIRIDSHSPRPHKRKRRSSSPPPPACSLSRDSELSLPLFSSLPLTAENLTRLQSQLDTMPPPTSGSRSPIKGSSKSGQSEAFKLRCFAVYYGGRNATLPTSLAKLKKEVFLLALQETPSAGRIASKAAVLPKLTETNGPEVLQKHLAPKSKVVWDDEGLDMVGTSGDSLLDASFLPEPSDPMVQAWFSKLDTPKPDFTVGYLRRHIADAHSPRLAAALTAAEERVAGQFDLCKEVAFPFLTFQWKSGITGGTIDAAERQSSRDGATCVNNMHQFLKAAYATDRDKNEPDVADTAHVSVTGDMRSVVVWLHWLHVDDEDGQITYEMEKLAQAFCDDAEGMLRVRYVIRNVVERAMTTRLAMIRDGIDALAMRSQAAVVTMMQQQRVGVALPSPDTTSRGSGSPSRKRARTTAMVGEEGDAASTGDVADAGG